jgi:hypothetical protein
MFWRSAQWHMASRVNQNLLLWNGTSFLALICSSYIKEVVSRTHNVYFPVALISNSPHALMRIFYFTFCEELIT